MKQQTVNQQKEGLRHSDHYPESVKNMAIYFTQKPMGIPDHLIITAHTHNKKNNGGYLTSISNLYRVYIYILYIKIVYKWVVY